MPPTTLPSLIRAREWCFLQNWKGEKEEIKLHAYHCPMTTCVQVNADVNQIILLSQHDKVVNVQHSGRSLSIMAFTLYMIASSDSNMMSLHTASYLTTNIRHCSKFNPVPTTIIKQHYRQYRSMFVSHGHKHNWWHFGTHYNSTVSVGSISLYRDQQTNARCSIHYTTNEIMQFE